jgi:cytochrome P450
MPLDQDLLLQEIIVIMFASIHSTSGTALAVLFDMIDHPESLGEIRQEIESVRRAHPNWTRQSSGELWILDSFMRETARVHALTQCKQNLLQLSFFFPLAALSLDGMVLG